MQVNQDELSVLELAVQSATAVMNKMPAIAGATPALTSAGTFDTATQNANIFFIGLVHTYYSAYCNVLLDTTDWAIPSGPTPTKPTGGGTTTGGTTPTTGGTTTTTTTTPTPVATSPLVAAIKAVMAAAIVLAFLFGSGKAFAQCPECNGYQCNSFPQQATINKEQVGNASVVVITPPFYAWNQSCHCGCGRQGCGNCGGQCGGCSAPGCHTSAYVSFRFHFFGRRR